MNKQKFFRICMETRGELPPTALRVVWQHRATTLTGTVLSYTGLGVPVPLYCAVTLRGYRRQEAIAAAHSKFTRWLQEYQQEHRLIDFGFMHPSVIDLAQRVVASPSPSPSPPPYQAPAYRFRPLGWHEVDDGLNGYITDAIGQCVGNPVVLLDRRATHWLCQVRVPTIRSDFANWSIPGWKMLARVKQDAEDFYQKMLIQTCLLPVSPFPQADIAPALRDLDLDEGSGRKR